jgi:hypothetical protein
MTGNSTINYLTAVSDTTHAAFERKKEKEQQT